MYSTYPRLDITMSYGATVLVHIPQSRGYIVSDMLGGILIYGG